MRIVALVTVWVWGCGGAEFQSPAEAGDALEVSWRVGESLGDFDRAPIDATLAGQYAAILTSWQRLVIHRVWPNHIELETLALNPVPGVDEYVAVAIQQDGSLAVANRTKSAVAFYAPDDTGDWSFQYETAVDGNPVDLCWTSGGDLFVATQDPSIPSYGEVLAISAPRRFVVGSKRRTGAAIQRQVNIASVDCAADQLLWASRVTSEVALFTVGDRIHVPRWRRVAPGARPPVLRAREGAIERAVPPDSVTRTVQAFAVGEVVGVQTEMLASELPLRILNRITYFLDPGSGALVAVDPKMPRILASFGGTLLLMVEHPDGTRIDLAESSPLASTGGE